MTALRLPDGTVCRTGPTCRLHGNLHTLQEQVYAAYNDAKKAETVAANDLTTKTPIEIDTKLAELDYERFDRMMDAVNYDKAKKAMLERMERSAKSAQAYNRRWVESGDAQKEVDNYDSKIKEAKAKVDELTAKMSVYDDEFNRRGGWTRAFFVANAGGHVHKSMNCSTCYPTTRFQWLTSYSGMEENEIVGDAGDRACTVCYSSAPVDLLRRPSKINDPEKEAARKERDEKKAAKDAATAAKAIANPDGTPLVVNGWKQKTERSAEIEAVSNLVDVEVDKTNPEYFPNREYLAEKKRDAERVLVALAHKHGTTVEDEQKRLAPKVAKKVKDWFK
jgi:hypothetical protein